MLNISFPKMDLMDGDVPSRGSMIYSDDSKTDKERILELEKKYNELNKKFHSLMNAIATF